MCKFDNFSVTHNLRETNFGESASCKTAKTAIFAMSGALNLVNLVNFSLLKY